MISPPYSVSHVPFLMSFTANTPSPPCGMEDGRTSRGGRTSSPGFPPPIARCVFAVRAWVRYATVRRNPVWALAYHRFILLAHTYRQMPPRDPLLWHDTGAHLRSCIRQKAGRCVQACYGGQATGAARGKSRRAPAAGCAWGCAAQTTLPSLPRPLFPPAPRSPAALPTSCPRVPAGPRALSGGSGGYPGRPPQSARPPAMTSPVRCRPQPIRVAPRHARAPRMVSPPRGLRVGPLRLALGWVLRAGARRPLRRPSGPRPRGASWRCVPTGACSRAPPRPAAFVHGTGCCSRHPCSRASVLYGNSGFFLSKQPLRTECATAQCQIGAVGVPSVFPA